MEPIAKGAEELFVKPAEFAGEQAFEAAQEGGEVFGVPVSVDPVAAGVAAEVGPQALALMAPSAKGTPFRATRADMKMLREEFESQGLKFDANLSPEQLAASLERQIGAKGEKGPFGLGVESKGRRAKVVVDSLVELKKNLKLHEDQAWAALRDTNAQLPADILNNTLLIAEEYLQPFGIGKTDKLPLGGGRSGRVRDPMKTVIGAFNDLKRTVGSAEKIKNLSPRIKIQAFVNFRKELVKAEGISDSTAAASATALKKAVDESLLVDYVAQVIKGDKNAIQAWKKAIASTQELKSIFNDIDIVKKLANAEVTAEQAAAFIFGDAKASFGVNTGQYVREIKNVLGEESPSFIAIQQEAALKIAQPLLKTEIDKTSIVEFVKNFEDTLKNRPTLVDELFPDQKGGLRRLVAIAKASSKADLGSKELLRINRALSVFMFGHQIARRALLVRTGEQALNVLKNAIGMSEKRVMLGEILGYDPMKSPFTKTGVVAGGVPQIPIPVDQRVQQDLGIAP
jgi:hypothetical protein